MLEATRQQASIGGPPAPRGPRGRLRFPLKRLRVEGAEGDREEGTEKAGGECQ